MTLEICCPVPWKGIETDAFNSMYHNSEVIMKFMHTNSKVLLMIENKIKRETLVESLTRRLEGGSPRMYVWRVRWIEKGCLIKRNL